MTDDHLAKLLATLPESRWDPRPPANEAAILSLEHEYDLRLPGDYRSLLLRSNGGAIGGERTAINLESVEVLMWHARDMRFVEHLPGMFVIGDDGGGAVYYYDPEDRHGRGDWALFVIPLAELGSDRNRFAGRNLTEAAERAVAGDTFFE